MGYLFFTTRYYVMTSSFYYSDVCCNDLSRSATMTSSLKNSTALFNTCPTSSTKVDHPPPFESFLCHKLTMTSDDIVDVQYAVANILQTFQVRVPVFIRARQSNETSR